MRELTINSNDAGQRLDRFIGKTVPLLPESLLQKYIRKKRVKVNGKAAKRDLRLSQGDTLQLYINDEFFQKPTEKNAYLKISVPHVDIVYEDENILLADKKPGVLCHSAEAWDFNTLITNIQAYLFQKGEWDPKAENSFTPALANRIDRNTSGIVIAAKNAPTLRILDEKLRTRELEKVYLAAIHGDIHPRDGELRGFIFKDSKLKQVYVRSEPEKGAKTALTRYRTLAVNNGLSLVECELLTGRTHQIRAQFSSVGHPLVGDGKYGSGKCPRQLNLPGQALCSFKLRFAFRTDSGILQYLNGKTFQTEIPDFVTYLFPDFVLLPD